MFSLPYEFAVPDVLYHHEMQGEWGERLVELGLRVEEVSKEGVSNALRYRAQRRVLSVPDSFALALAKERAWSLLTGDNQLRELAAGEDVECHGVLWLLDPMEEAGIPALQALHDGLAVLAAIDVAACRAVKSRSGWSDIGQDWANEAVPVEGIDRQSKLERV